MKTSFVWLSVLILSLAISCSVPPKSEPAVVTTNGWTAAFAKAAGAKKIIVLAPYEMTHPAEYELKASDIPVLINARLFIYAGYESMVQRIQSGMNIDPERMLKIETDYSMAIIEQSVMKIAQILGTENIARRNIDSIRLLMTEGKNRLQNLGANRQPLVVNFFQKSIVTELGLTIGEVFGPTPLEATDIDRVAKNSKGMIVDNEHNPVGKPLQMIGRESTYVQLLNFPGNHHTTTLKDVIQYNISQLSKFSGKMQ